MKYFYIGCHQPNHAYLFKRCYIGALGGYLDEKPKTFLSKQLDTRLRKLWWLSLGDWRICWPDWTFQIERWCILVYWYQSLQYLRENSLKLSFLRVAPVASTGGNPRTALASLRFVIPDSCVSPDRVGANEIYLMVINTCVPQWVRSPCASCVSPGLLANNWTISNSTLFPKSVTGSQSLGVQKRDQ